jgi:hypothetical protein
MMRYRGGGVGHKTTREATNSFKSDRDPLDNQEISTGFNDEDKVDEDGTLREIQEEDGEIHDEDGEIREDDDERVRQAEEEIQEEEEDYGYAREDSEEESDMDDDAEVDDEAEFGPEDDGGAIDPDMDALGYAEM